MNIWRAISIGLFGVLLVLIAVYLFVWRWDRVTIYNSGDDQASDHYDNYFAGCSAAGINYHGTLQTYVTDDDSTADFASSENIMFDLEEAELAESVKAIVLEIDSYGGMPVAAEEIANKIKGMDKPVVAMVRGAAASAGYWVASAADRIFASELSDIGSIGVTMSYIDNSKLNEKEGYTWNSLSTGKFKDSGDFDKPLTKEERALFERDIQIIFDKFIKTVSENRGLSLEKVRSLADGSTMMGSQALANGLIDEIGFLPEVEKYLKDTYGVEGEVCW